MDEELIIPVAIFVFLAFPVWALVLLHLIKNRQNEQAKLINSLLFHFATSKLPFGGVGPSGMGAYHGKFGFEEFSHRKTVMTKPTRPDLTAIIYPPYTEKAFKLARKLF